MNVRSYPTQPLTTLVVPSLPSKISTPGGGVALAVSYQANAPLNVPQWTTRFQTLFEEYRIIRLIARINLFSSTTPGTLVTYWDEKTPFTAPTLAAATERRARQVSNSSVTRPLVLKWKARDLLDLQYTPIASSSTPVSLCIYTDNAVLGAPTAATDIGTVDFEYHIQFRGYETV